MARGIMKTARSGISAKTGADKDLSFSSDWKTPKIFLQTNQNWTNTLNYIPSFMSFRQLNATDFAHDLLFSDDTDPFQGAYLDADGDLHINKRSGDTDMWSLLYLDPISGTPPLEYSLGKGGMILLANEGNAKTNFPTQNSVDTRFDTFKIFDADTLQLDMPDETISAGTSKRYTATVHHNLGYPPVYLPEAGMNWPMGYSGIGGNSFVVNDMLGFLGNPLTIYSDYYNLDVYVDSEYLYMEYTRSADGVGDEHFNACSVTMYYTIFYNQIGEEFNFLNNDYK